MASPRLGDAEEAKSQHRHQHHEPQRAATAKQLGLEARQAEAEQPDLQEQRGHGAVGALRQAAAVIGERLHHDQPQHGAKPEQAGGRAEIEIAVVGIAGAVTPGLVEIPIRHQAGVPQKDSKPKPNSGRSAMWSSANSQISSRPVKVGSGSTALTSVLIGPNITDPTLKSVMRNGVPSTSANDRNRLRTRGTRYDRKRTIGSRMSGDLAWVK